MEAKITKLTPNKTKSTAMSLTIAIGGLVLLLAAIAWPLATIWALNVLFQTNIQYNFQCWLSCWILIFTFQKAITISRKKD